MWQSVADGARAWQTGLGEQGVGARNPVQRRGVGGGAYVCAISGTRGSSGFGSVSSDDSDSKTFEMVSAGLHWSFKMSRQILPLALMLGWYIRVVN